MNKTSRESTTTTPAVARLTNIQAGSPLGASTSESFCWPDPGRLPTRRVPEALSFRENSSIGSSAFATGSFLAAGLEPVGFAGDGREPPGVGGRSLPPDGRIVGFSADTFVSPVPALFVLNLSAVWPLTARALGAG